MPFWLAATCAALVLLLSFIGLARLWNRPRFEAEDQWRPVSERINSLVVNPVTDVLAGLIGVVLLLVTVWSGLRGLSHWTPTFLFVTFWLGLIPLSVLFGDVFRAFNPWRALARAGSAVMRVVVRRSIAEPVAYPERLGRWPALVPLLAFVWLELNHGGGILPQTGFTDSPGAPPRVLGQAALIYTLYTFLGMATFGTDQWLRRGEGFSVYFGMFASLAPLAVRDGRLGRRPWFFGANRWAARIPGSTAVVLFALGATVFDGVQFGLLEPQWIWVWTHLMDAGLGGTFARHLTSTLMMAVVLLAVVAIYLLGIYGMKRTAGGGSVKELAHRFCHSFIPLALGYLVAHYFAYFIFQEQAQFTYLLSDPLGYGWDLVGLRGTHIEAEVVRPWIVWTVQVVAFVSGHVLGLVMAHDRALAVYRDSRAATRSQYWMLALMVLFTLFAVLLVSELVAVDAEE